MTFPITCIYLRFIHTTYSGYTSGWFARVNNVVGSSGQGRNKLRLYKSYKSQFETEPYCKLIMPPRHRSAFCKFRLGVAPIRLETGRYEGLPEVSRVCPFCDTCTVENEIHVMLLCPVYDDIRSDLLLQAVASDSNFQYVSNLDKYCLLFSNSDLIRCCAKTCFNILQRRQFLLTK